MNISQEKIITLTDDEWNMIDYKDRIRMFNTAVYYSSADGEWTFRFHGISDKQVMTELCADFGITVKE